MSNIYEIPPGVRDLLPHQARWKRQMEDRLAELFSRWGYEEVLTPTFEYYSSLTEQGSGLDEELLYKFLDRNGRIMALRPDMTTPIARMVSSRMRGEPLPLRLFYLANVFRYEKTHAGRQREFFQAGVELLGAKGPKADAEVLSLAVAALETAGLKDFRIGVGQVEATKALLGELDRESSTSFKEAIASKDFVQLEILLEKSRVSARERDILVEVAMSRGGVSDLEQLLDVVENRDAYNALSELVEIFKILQYQGLEEKVFFDLGILRDFDYYTGIVFEGYVPNLGFPVCGGGRYDNLLEKFGYPLAATGFAVGLERVMLALREPESDREQGYLLLGSFPKVLDRAGQLRRQGYRVVVCYEQLPRGEAEKLAAAKGLTLLVEEGEQ